MGQSVTGTCPRVTAYDAYYEHTPMSIGWGVEAAPVGDVIVKSGHKLSVKNGTGGVLIESGFECKKGGVFEIK